MQTWSIDCTLKSWQVKTICPVSWSAGEGDGTAVRADAEVGFAVGKLRPGEAVGPFTAGDENEEGVEACSVANRSGVGEERMGLLQARITRRGKIAKRKDVTLQLLRDRMSQIIEVFAEGDSVVTRMFSLIYLADFVSIYLALARGIDPGQVEVIDLFKRKMAE